MRPKSETRFFVTFGGLAGAGKRQTRGTICEAENFFNINKINNEMNLLKMEEKERQKVQRIMGGSDYQRILYELISNSKFDNGVMFCVFINILLLIMPTMPSSVGLFFRRLENPMDVIDDGFMAVYLIECVLKIYVLRKEYFKAWDLLDFQIVVISLVDLIIGVTECYSTGGSIFSSGSTSGLKVTKLLRLLRATRMLRVLRTLKFIDRLQRYTVTILKSIISLGPILQLTCAFIFMFSAIGCSLFGDIIPKHFGNVFLTLFTLIKLVTLDDWYEILQHGSMGTSQMNLPLLFFLVIFIFVMVFVIFNLLIAVLVDTFNVANEENRVKLSHEEAVVRDAVAKIEAMESDHESDSETGLDGLLGQEDGPKKKDKVLGHEEDFCHYFTDCLPTDLMLRQWYFRILPAIERQKFYYNDQMSSYNRMVEEAISSTDEVFTAR